MNKNTTALRVTLMDRFLGNRYTFTVKTAGPDVVVAGFLTTKKGESRTWLRSTDGGNVLVPTQQFLQNVTRGVTVKA